MKAEYVVVVEQAHPLGPAYSFTIIVDAWSIARLLAHVHTCVYMQVLQKGLLTVAQPILIGMDRYVYYFVYMDIHVYKQNCPIIDVDEMYNYTRIF